MIQNLVPAVSGGLQLYKAYKDFNAPDVDYDILQLTAEQKDIEAESVLAEVEQEANAIREQFVESVGVYKAAKARRGIKVTEGDVAENIERSAIAEGQDVQTIRGNAKFQAEQLRAKGEQYRAGAEAQKEIGYWERFSKATQGLLGAYESFKQMGGIGEAEDVAGEMATGKDPMSAAASVGIKKKKKRKANVAAMTSSYDSSSVGSYTITGKRTKTPNILSI